MTLRNQHVKPAEVEFSRTHFEVFGLSLEASSPRKLPCPLLEDSTIFEPLKFRWNTPETLRKICKNLFFGFLKERSSEKNFFWRSLSPEKIFCRPFCFEIARKKILKTFFFCRTLASVSLVLGLGLERVCPWPRNFFTSLALVSSLVSSTPPMEA